MIFFFVGILFVLSMYLSLQWDKMRSWTFLKVNSSLYSTNMRAVVSDGSKTWQVNFTHKWFDYPKGTFVGNLVALKYEFLLEEHKQFQLPPATKPK